MTMHPRQTKNYRATIVRAAIAAAAPRQPPHRAHSRSSSSSSSSSCECTAMHYDDSNKIDCNSSIQPGDDRYTNKKFGICRNFAIGRECMVYADRGNRQR